MGRLELPASCSQSKRATNCATPGYEIFQLWSNMWSTPIFDQLPATGKVLSAQVSQGFPGFPRDTARTWASRSQSKRATNCATPGYEVFQLWSNMGSAPVFDQFPARGKTPSALASQSFPGFWRSVARTPASRSQITCATNCATPGYKMIITVVKHVVNSNCQSVRGGDLSVPCLSYFTKLQSNVKPSLYGRSWFQTVQLQRQTRRYTSPGDNSKDSPPSRTPLLHTGRMPLHKSTS